MIAHDSWWSNERARFNYHRLSSTIIDYHAPFDQGFILQLLYCRARLFVFVARSCVTCHGYLSLDPFCSIVASLKAVQCVKLRLKAAQLWLCFFIAPFRSVRVRFVFMLRELRISSCVMLSSLYTFRNTFHKVVTFSA